MNEKLAMYKRSDDRRFKANYSSSRPPKSISSISFPRASATSSLSNKANLCLVLNDFQ